MPQPVSEPVTSEELLRLPLFDGENPEAVEWIAGRMEMLRYESGEVVWREGEAVTTFAVILEGEVHFKRENDPSANLTVMVSGQAIGILPFSRMTKGTGRLWAIRPTRLGSMDASHLRELVYRAPLLAQRLVSIMTDRARDATRREESTNRLLALGKLSAGLAHELNNPASAAVRSSARLRDALTRRRMYAIALLGQVLPQAACDIMVDLTHLIAECASTPGSMDALERADRESDLADWLDSVGAPGELASELVDARITVEQLRPLAALVPGENFVLGMRMLVADHEILCLTRELEEAAHRVSDLVQSVKLYSYMDQSPVAEVDVARGIDITLRMFQHQLKHGVQVVREFAPDLPRIRANGSALNQIWTNLIDNALDAMDSLPPDEQKKLSVRTCQEPGEILVEIADNGPGIPSDAKCRIFEPFFTTKTVGEGTGLGLDIVQRIVRNHRGSIHVESAPGRTVFQVRLPI
jgi:signal transduction histidine kinase